MTELRSGSSRRSRADPDIERRRRIVWLVAAAAAFFIPDFTDTAMPSSWLVIPFVAAGFEHCVANMYFIPVALFIKQGGPSAFWAASGASPDQFIHLTWSGFLQANLLPVTLGNIVGGAVFVAGVYWLAYCRSSKHAPETEVRR